MNLSLRIALLAAIGIYFLLLFFLLKKKRLILKYCLLWILSGVIMLIIAIFPNIIHWFSNLVGIYDPTTALFSILFFCVFIILISLTVIVSRLSSNNRKLIQMIALLEKKIRQLKHDSEDIY